MLESADLLFEYVDRVTRIYAEADEEVAKFAASTAEEEAGARALPRRIAADDAPLPEDRQLAERIGFQLDRASRPFVIAALQQPVEYHAQLAADLRRRGALAASEGRRLAGLAASGSSWEGLDLHPRTIVARGPAAIGAERGRALDELRDAVEVAIRRGDRGEIEVESYLAELLLLRSPRIGDQIAEQI